MDKNKLFCLAFSHFLGVGPIKFRSLVKVFGSAEVAYQVSERELEKILGGQTAQKFSQFRQKFDPEKKWQELVEKKISIITQFDQYFPISLKNIPDPPICLYVKGNIDEINLNKEFCFAVVGTRQPTAYGQQLARTFARQLAEEGLIIVSGMAVGIDTLAHQSALFVKKKTVAVLGCGVDIVYPAANIKLYREIIKSGGLVISEFPPGQRVLKGLFVARNRIISGLSQGVLIVEGAKDSGALITARYAAEQGKEVFAPPAPITSKMSAAPNLLLKQGAKLVTAVEDIFEEFNLKVVPRKKENIFKKLSAEERKILEILSDKPQTADDLAIRFRQPINLILNRLSVLEIKGVIVKNDEGKYLIK